MTIMRNFLPVFVFCLFVNTCFSQENQLQVEEVFTLGTGGPKHGGTFYHSEYAFCTARVFNFLPGQDTAMVDFSLTLYAKENPSLMFSQDNDRDATKVMLRYDERKKSYLLVNFVYHMPGKDDLPPGEYLFEIVVMDTVSGRTGKSSIPIRLLATGHFGCESMTFVKPKEFWGDHLDFKGTIPIPPLFSHIDNRPVRLYFQVNGYLTNDFEGVDLIVELNQVDENGTVICTRSLSAQLSGYGDQRPIVLAMQLQLLRPGKQKAIVTVHDRIGDQTCSFEIPYMVVDLNRELYDEDLFTQPEKVAE